MQNWKTADCKIVYCLFISLWHHRLYCITGMIITVV